MEYVRDNACAGVVSFGGERCFGEEDFSGVLGVAEAVDGVLSGGTAGFAGYV